MFRFVYSLNKLYICLYEEQNWRRKSWTEKLTCAWPIGLTIGIKWKIKIFILKFGNQLHLWDWFARKRAKKCGNIQKNFHSQVISHGLTNWERFSKKKP